MLLTTPTSLSFLEESSLRTNNSSSHIIFLSLIFITPSLSLFFSLSPLSLSLSPPFPCLLLYPSFSFIVTVLSPPLPQFTLSLTSQCCIDFREASPVISPYLLIPTLTPSLSTLQGCFPSTHAHTIFPSFSIIFSISSYLCQAHAVFPFQTWLSFLISFSTLLSFSFQI